MFRRNSDSPTPVGRRRRPSPALVLASMALFVALGGVGYAAATIGSAQIKNNSVQGKDIRNGTIKSTDIAKGTRNALKGQKGANGTNGASGAIGPQGLAGQTGAQGPAGPSNVRFAANDNVFLEIPACADTALDTCSSLLAVGMTPGDYLVTATANVDNANAVATGFSNRCGLFRGGDVLNEVRFSLTANGTIGETENIAMQQVVSATDSSTPISLRCTQVGGEDIRLELPRLTVLKVGSVGT